MDVPQKDQYGEIVEKWKRAVIQYGQGWDEDDPEIPVDYEIDVDMVKYRLAGLFSYFDGKRQHVFSTPVVSILARVRSVKAHMNRMISAVEWGRDKVAEGQVGQAVPIVAWSKESVDLLHGAHHGTRFKVHAATTLTTKLAAHCTGLPSTLPWEFGFSFERNLASGTAVDRYGMQLRTTVFTVCPFVLFETGGKQSHTQRTHLLVELEADTPMEAAPIMREICQRLVPVMSNMKIPDETVQVLKSYAGPTFTEDAAVRVVKILKGITAEFCPEGQVTRFKVTAISEDSHLAHDITTSLETDINA